MILSFTTFFYLRLTSNRIHFHRRSLSFIVHFLSLFCYFIHLPWCVMLLLRKLNLVLADVFLHQFLLGLFIFLNFLLNFSHIISNFGCLTCFCYSFLRQLTLGERIYILPSLGLGYILLLCLLYGFLNLNSFLC